MTRVRGIQVSNLTRLTVKCQDPNDGSGDVVIDLPPELLAAMSLGLGDRLSIERIGDTIVLKPIRDSDPDQKQSSAIE